MELSVGKAPYTVKAEVIQAGRDLAVVITGGIVPHIGAAALATPRLSLKQDGSISASASVLCQVGHKDDLPAREAALRLAAALNTTVLVSVGIHVDAAQTADLQALQANFAQLLSLLERKLAV